MIVLALMSGADAEPGRRLTLTVHPTKPEFVLGEPLWVELRFSNPDSLAIVLGLVDWVSHRAGVELEVTDRRGHAAPDTWHRPGPRALAVGFPELEVPGKGSATFPLDLARHGWVATPGRWDVRLRLAPDDPWVTTRIKVVPATPETAAAVVEALPRTIDEQLEGGGPTVFYESLGHPLYVPILEALAGDDLARSERELPVRAVAGLSACPCTEATEALLRLYDQLEDPEHRGAVADELLLRSPPPVYYDTSPWFLEQAWDERFVEPMLVRARAALEVPSEGPGSARGYAWAGAVVRKMGGPDDVLPVVDALARMLTAEAAREWNGTTRLYAVELGRALDARAPSDPEAIRVLALARWDHGADEPDWDILVRALASDRTTIVLFALSLMPATPSPALIEAVRPHLASSDPAVAAAAARFLARPP